MQDQPLNDADFEFIEDMLLKYGDDHSVLNPSELDGYLSALVSGPLPIDISVWFPAIWGDQNPNWETPQECKRFIDLSVRHMNARATQLATDVQAFKARFEETEHQGQPLVLAEEWCFGYLRGIGVSQWPEQIGRAWTRSPCAPNRTTSNCRPTSTWFCIASAWPPSNPLCVVCMIIGRQSGRNRIGRNIRLLRIDRH